MVRVKSFHIEDILTPPSPAEDSCKAAPLALLAYYGYPMPLTPATPFHPALHPPQYFVWPQPAEASPPASPSSPKCTDSSLDQSSSSSSSSGAADQDLSHPPSWLQKQNQGNRRKKYARWQSDALMAIYRKSPFVSRKEMFAIGQMVQLSQKQVKTWFQNRRLNDKKKLQRARAE